MQWSRGLVLLHIQQEHLQGFAMADNNWYKYRQIHVGLLILLQAQVIRAHARFYGDGRKS